MNQPTTSTTTTQDAALTAGLHWIYDTTQPADAWQQHHGDSIRAEGNRTYRFIPVGFQQRPVVVVDVTEIEWIDNGPNDLAMPANPLEPGELEALAAELERHGYPVEEAWNGNPGLTGSVCLARPAHPSQVASVERYRRGCTVHPARSVFCDCEAWRGGFRRIVRLTPPMPTA